MERRGKGGDQNQKPRDCCIGGCCDGASQTTVAGLKPNSNKPGAAPAPHAEKVGAQRPRTSPGEHSREQKTIYQRFSALPLPQSALCADNMYKDLSLYSEYLEAFRSSLQGPHSSTKPLPSNKSIHPSQYEEEVEEKVEVQVPVGFGKKDENKVFTLLLPKIAVVDAARGDVMVFYRIPVGYALWDGAHALMCALLGLENGGSSKLAQVVGPRFFRGSGGLTGATGPSVLELGCGAAPLPGMVSALLGARYVRCTDFLPGLVELADENIMRSADLFEETNVAKNVDVDIAACSLPWGDMDAIQNVLPKDQAYFDVVLGADIVAGEHDGVEEHKKVLNLLADTINAVTRKGSLLILSHTVRQPGVERWLVEEVLVAGSWEVVETIEDDSKERWQKYGRVAFNTNTATLTSTTTRIVLLVLERK
eukprot:g15761.t1